MNDPPTRPTPSIPERIRAFRAQPHFTSIFEFYPTETRLYGTEDWHGDWNARVLFMAKDAGSSRIFRPVVRGGRGWAWITDPSRPTNKNLGPLLETLPSGKLYASFLGPLLRNDDRESGSLPRSASVDRFTDDLFRWTVGEMQHLQIVAVLGREAWVAVTRAAGSPERVSDWKRRHVAGSPLGIQIAGRHLWLVALNHPARIPSELLMNQAGWKWIVSQLGMAGQPTARQPSESPPRSLATIRTSAAPSGAGLWVALSPRKTKRQHPVNIRAGLLDLLKAAGQVGASPPAFAHLPWQNGLRHDKLKIAMGYLAGETGLAIEYQGRLSDGSPARYRLAP